MFMKGVAYEIRIQFQFIYFKLFLTFFKNEATKRNVTET